MHLFIQPIFAEDQLYARLFSGHMGHINEQNRQYPVLAELIFWWEETNDKQKSYRRCWNGGSQLGVILPPLGGGHLATSADITSRHNAGRSATGVSLIEASHASKHSIAQRSISNYRELSRLKCQ